jgi:hypothetical protein
MHQHNIYYELCNTKTMSLYPFFIDKLIQIENNVKIENDKHINKYIKLNTIKCPKCESSEYYLLGNIFWSDIIKHKISEHNLYPSEYFMNVILTTVLKNNIIINPPMILPSNKINSFKYIPLHKNKLLIIDALMNQGSYPRYQNGTDYVFSEHSGVISLKDDSVDNIIVFTNTDRIDPTDSRILLPNNIHYLAQYEYMFHTHPKTIKNAGRIKEGILYEFPSAGDIFNFIKYHNEGKALASIIVAPEGIYIIRQLVYRKHIDIDASQFFQLNQFIMKLEKQAVKKYKSKINKIGNSNSSKRLPSYKLDDYFFKNVATDYTFIELYNKYIKPSELTIEYHPREFINNEWTNNQIYLQYIK